jgi:hypothetical protein
MAPAGKSPAGVWEVLMQSRLDGPGRHQSFPILTHMTLRYLDRSIAQSAPAYGLRCSGFRQHFTPWPSHCHQRAALQLG